MYEITLHEDDVIMIMRLIENEKYGWIKRTAEEKSALNAVNKAIESQLVSVDGMITLSLDFFQTGTIMVILSDTDAKEWVNAGQPDEWDSDYELVFDMVQEQTGILTNMLYRWNYVTGPHID